MSLDVPKPPFKVKAHYSWSGETKNDLGFLENDIIEVTKIKGNWFYGTLLRNSKKYGYFPTNYVTIVQERYNNYGTPPSARKENNGSGTAQKLFSRSTLPPVPTRDVEPIDAYYDAMSNYRNRAKVGMEGSLRGPRHVTDTNFTRAKTVDKISGIPQLPQSYSTSNIVSMTPRAHKSGRYARPHVPESHKIASKAYPNNTKSQLRDDTLPPLPPIPSLNLRVKNKTTLPKSFSSNDLPNPRAPQFEADYRKSYYRSSADFYDQNGPAINSDDPSSMFSQSQYLEDSVASSEDSFALMSDFSATSAGSLARHRFARSFNDSFEKSQGAVDDAAAGAKGAPVVSTKFGGMFRKLLTKTNDSSPSTPTDDYPRLPDLTSLQLSSSSKEANGWVEAKAQLHRAQTLSSRERHERQMKALEENRDIVLHPQEYINEDINTNEVRHGHKPGLVDIELSCIDYQFINELTKRRARKGSMHSIESFTQHVFSSAYKSSVQKLCGVFMFCTETFKLIDDNGRTNFGAEPERLDKIFHKSYCTPYELTWIFKKMAYSLGIHCEIVIGFLKTPGANNFEFKFNHCWLRILINDEWRFVDVILGNMTNPIHEYINNKTPEQAEKFYFLCQPLYFIYTHVPRLYQEQHIIPVIDQNIALCLPVVFPSFFKNELRLFKFSNGLLKLLDTQIFECSLLIPNDIELFSAVVVEGPEGEKFKNLDLSLVQVRHRKKERVAVVKAILPSGASRGMLHVHSGVKGTQTSVANIHPLSLIIPLEHCGHEKDYEFLQRIPSKTVQKIDIYIKKPQNKYLLSCHDYNFQVIQNPCDGITYGSPGISKSFRQSLALQSPSGKIHLLKKSDPNIEFGTWEISIKPNEPGIWVGLVTSDTGAGWCPYAKWWCL